MFYISFSFTIRTLNSSFFFSKLINRYCAATSAGKTFFLIIYFYHILEGYLPFPLWRPNYTSTITSSTGHHLITRSKVWLCVFIAFSARLIKFLSYHPSTSANWTAERFSIIHLTLSLTRYFIYLVSHFWQGRRKLTASLNY